MSVKKSVDVLIGGKMYTLSGYEETGYLERIASYINKKIEEGKGLEYWKSLSRDMQKVMLMINMADDFFKAKDRVSSMEEDKKAKEKELYDLKHSLVDDQVKIQDLEDQIKKVTDENKELKLNKSKLEASLEDALLGTPTRKRARRSTKTDSSANEKA